MIMYATKTDLDMLVFKSGSNAFCHVLCRYDAMVIQIHICSVLNILRRVIIIINSGNASCLLCYYAQWNQVHICGTSCSTWLAVQVLRGFASRTLCLWPDFGYGKRKSSYCLSSHEVSDIHGKVIRQHILSTYWRLTYNHTHAMRIVHEVTMMLVRTVGRHRVCCIHES